MLLTQATLFLHSPFTFDAACASVYIDCLLRREAEGAGGGGGGRFIQRQSDGGGGGEVSDVMQAVGTIRVPPYDTFFGMVAQDGLCAKLSLLLSLYLSIYI